MSTSEQSPSTGSGQARAGQELNLSARPIVLCGFMGVGKSAIGRVLAKLVERPFLDSDTEIVSRLGRSIESLFQTGDEALFRATEAAVIADLLNERPAAVIAVGGGALESSATRALLADQALVVHIDQPWEELSPALTKLRVTRPLLVAKSEEEVHELFLKRDANYRSAHLSVRTPRQGVRTAARRVLSAIEELCAKGP